MGKFRKTGLLLQANANIQRLGMPRPKFDAEQQIYTVENPQTNEQYEFNGRGMHLRTKALADGVTLQEMEYARDGRLLTIREGGGGEGAARELLEAKATEKKEMDGDEDGDILIAKVRCRRIEEKKIEEIRSQMCEFAHFILLLISPYRSAAAHWPIIRFHFSMTQTRCFTAYDMVIDRHSLAMS